MKQIGLLLPPGFQALDFMASTVFEVANTLLDEPCYDMTVLSEEGGMLASSSGIQVLTAPITRYDYDTLLVAGQMMPGAARPRNRAASPPCARAPSCWPRPGCWKAGAPPPTGSWGARCSTPSRACRSTRTASSSMPASSGPRPA